MKRSRLTLFVFLAAWLLSLAVVYTLGVFSAFSFHRAPDGEALEGQPLEDRAYALLAARLLNEPVAWSELKSGDSQNALPAQVRNLLMALNREPDAARREAAAATIAEAYPSRKVVPAVQQLLAEPSSPGRDALLTAFFRRWGSIDGRSALDFTLTTAIGNGLEDAAVRAALKGWAEARPESAWNWVRQNPAENGEEQAARYAAVLAAHRGLPQSRVVEWLNELEDPGVADRVAGQEAERLLVARGPRAALSFAEAVTDDYASRVAVISDVLEEWTRQDRASALSWFETIEPENRGWALPAIASSWSERDGAGALRWLAEQPASPARATAMREAARIWLRNGGPAPLGEFLNAAEELSNYSPAIEMLALETMALDPETAFSWAGLVEDPSRRRYIMASVGAYWLAVEPEEAEAALRELDAGPALEAIYAEEDAATRRVVVNGESETYELAPGESIEIQQEESADAPVYIEVGPAEAEAEPEVPSEEGAQ